MIVLISADALCEQETMLLWINLFLLGEISIQLIHNNMRAKNELAQMLKNLKNIWLVH